MIGNPGVAALDGFVVPDLLSGRLQRSGHLAGMARVYRQYPELFGALVCQQPLLDMREHDADQQASGAAAYGTEL